MNFLILIVVAVAGIIIGSYFGVRKKNETKSETLISEQAKQKQKNKEKILEFLNSHDPDPMDGQRKITNDDVEKLLGVSDATATRHLSELEKEQKIKQVGTVGHAVYYLLI